jgi:2-amino-4-hydroxy-6-hydroxymethyldihydropteridine diphosphokinase
LIRESVYLALGSNLGDRERILDRAVVTLADHLEDIRCSSIYETRPMYVERQPLFLNMVVGGFCSSEPEVLLNQIQKIEIELGRERNHTVPKGPRVIDIDMLLFGGRVIRSKNLSVPHPHMRERQFVLIPLLELQPDLRDPENGRPLSEVLQGLEDQGVYIFRA